MKFVSKLVELGFTIEYSCDGIVIRGDIPRKIEEKIHKSNFNFNECTDTFITFCIIIAGLADGLFYRINGISNQRLKECNRIHAICKNLNKFGVKT